MIVGLIPARSGSKGIPDKNIKELGGQPLMIWSIKTSLACTDIDMTVVSTDSQRYADIAGRAGACVMERPAHLASDHSPDIGYLQHFVNESQGASLIVLLRPTTPFRDPAIISKAIDVFRNDKHATALRSVHELREPPEKMMRIMHGKLTGIFPNNSYPEYYNLPRQHFKPAYHPNGYVDILSPKVIKHGMVYGFKILPFVTEEVIEIDREVDFERAEQSLQIRT